MPISHHIHGKGPAHVIVMHDWFGDRSNYDPMLPYLDTARFTYAFADLRGYGHSRTLKADCTLEEASSDILNLAEALQWPEFHLVGHSMSGMIAQYIALIATKRVTSVVAITPVPAVGAPAPEPLLQYLEDAAIQNDESALQIVNFMTSARYAGSHFPPFKVEKWRATSTKEARVRYLKMFTSNNFADRAKGLTTPLLVITGGCDQESYRDTAQFLTLYPNARITIFQESGHYPMQEEPVLLASTIESFLTSLAP